jgi:hypothetical protein
VKSLDAAADPDAPVYTGSDEDLRESLLDICNGLPMTHTDLQNCDEMVDECQVRQRVFLRQSILKMIILPSQARDKT